MTDTTLSATSEGLQQRRGEFSRWCDAHNIEVVKGGADWHDALNREAFLCGIVKNRQDFAAAYQLTQQDAAYMATATGWHKPRWVCHHGAEALHWDDARSYEGHMEAAYVEYLRNAPEVAYYSAETLQQRQVLGTFKPKRPGELPADYAQRLSQVAGRQLPPMWATRPGYWHVPTGEDLHMDAWRERGMWCFDSVPGASWTRYVILVCEDQR